MRVGVIDVGANTLRLLVADVASGVDAGRETKVQLGLGEDVERYGRVGSAKLQEAGGWCGELVAEARAEGAVHVEAIVTSPGRQAANGEELAVALARAGGIPVRLLTAEEEARLGYCGALAVTRVEAESVAVCDVGGGSSQIAVGTRVAPAWLRSVDIGSLRLTTRLLFADPPGKKLVNVARVVVREAFESVAPPLPRVALATGGSARALRKIVGGDLGEPELAEAVRVLRKTRRCDVVREFKIDAARARTLVAGALILSEIQQRLAQPLLVARGGVREGAAVTFARELEAAA